MKTLMATPPTAERRRIHILVGQALGLTAAYALLTGFFTRPLFWHWGSYTPAGGFSSDQSKAVSSFWWAKSTLLDLQQSPFLTDAINTPLLYNLMLTLSFVLTGMASFLLIRTITGRAGVSFVASLFVVFAPYRLWHLDHLNLLSAEWGILAAVCAISFFRNARWLALCGAVVFVVASFYADLTNMIVAILFIGAYVILYWRQLWDHPQRKRILAGAGIGVVIAVVLVAPGLSGLSDAQSGWQLGWQGIEGASAELAGFLLPASGDLVTGRGEVYLGWLLLSLAVIAVAYFRNSEVRKWAIAAGVFLVLSLGLNLPIVGAQLCLAILAAFALDGWFAGLRDQVARRWYIPAAIVAGGIIVAGICIEYSTGPIRLVPMEAPAAIDELATGPFR